MNTANTNKAPYIVPWGRRVTGREIPFGSTDSEGDVTPTSEICSRAKKISLEMRLTIKGGPRTDWYQCDGDPGGATHYYKASMKMKRRVEPNNSICRQDTPDESDNPGSETVLCPCEDGCCVNDSGCTNQVTLNESGYRDQAPVQWGGQGDIPQGLGSATLCKCNITAEQTQAWERLSAAILEKMRTEKVAVTFSINLENVRQFCCVGEGGTAAEQAASLEDCQRMVYAGYKVNWDDYPDWVRYMFMDANNEPLTEQLLGNFNLGPFHIPDTRKSDGHVCEDEDAIFASNMFEMEDYVDAKCQKPRKVLELMQGLMVVLKGVGMDKLCTLTTAPGPDIVRLVDGPFGSPAEDILYPIGHPVHFAPDCPVVPRHLLQMVLNVLTQISPSAGLC